MKYTIHLQGNALTMVEGNIISTKDVYEWKITNGIVEFWLDAELQKSGFYKLEDVMYVLPKE